MSVHQAVLQARSQPASRQFHPLYVTVSPKYVGALSDSAVHTCARADQVLVSIDLHVGFAIDDLSSRHGRLELVATEAKIIRLWPPPRLLK